MYNTPSNNGGCSSVGRAPDCDSGGRGFEPHHSPQSSQTHGLQKMDLSNSIKDMILQHAEVDAIYLYGSRAKGTATADSDWDIAVLYTHFLQIRLERVERVQALPALL